MKINPFILLLAAYAFNYCNSQSIYRPMFYPNTGVLIEPDSVVISYDQTKYVSIIYDISGPKLKAITTCDSIQGVINQTSKILQTHFDHLQSIIPQNSADFMNEFCVSHLGLCQEIVKNSTSRPKRSGAILAAMSGLIGLGNSAYTWYTGNRLEQHLNIVRSKMLEMIEEESKTTDKLNEVIALENDIVKKSSTSFKNLRTLFETEGCRLETKILKTMVDVMIQEIYSDFTAIINMINGKPDPYIMTSSVIDKILKRNSDLASTVYHSDKGLLLTVSRSNLIYSSDHKNHLIFLLEIPIIKTNMYSPLFRVYNGGWEVNGVYHRLDLPINFYLYGSSSGKDFSAVSSIHDNCYYRSHLYICDNSKHFLKGEMICMNALLKNSSYGNCNTKVTKQPPEISIVKTKSGVFATGNPIVTKIDSVGEAYHMITDSVMSSNYTQFYPYATFHKLIIDSIIIVSNKDSVPILYINHTYSLDLDFSLDDAHSFLINNPWTSVKTIQALVKSDSLYTMSRLYHTSTGYSLYIILSLVFVTISLIIILYILWKRVYSTNKGLKRNQVVLSHLIKNQKFRS